MALNIRSEWLEYNGWFWKTLTDWGNIRQFKKSLHSQLLMAASLWKDVSKQSRAVLLYIKED